MNEYTESPVKVPGAVNPRALPGPRTNAHTVEVLVPLRPGTVPVVACSARTCKRDAIPGGTVCIWHGGQAPAVREAARRRLMAMIPTALGTMLDLASSATSEAVRQRAAADILDRTGLKAPDETIVVQTGETNAALDAAILAALERRTAVPAVGPGPLGTPSGTQTALPEAPHPS